MGSHRIFGIAAALAAVVACGDPGAVTSGSGPETGGEATAVGNLAAPAQLSVCTEAPFVPAVENSPPDGLGPVVNSWVEAHPDLFAGMWWDGAVSQFVLSTVDAEGAASLIQHDLPADLQYRVEQVARSASQLATLQAKVPELATYGIEASSAQRVWDALLEVDLPILDERSLDAVRKVFVTELDAICVTGADPATVPPDGPQPTSGDGWRLLADQIHRGEPYSAHVAVNAAEYSSLWASLGLTGYPPVVDFNKEIVVHFGAVYSGSCPEIRLDDLNIDRDRSLVTAKIVQLGGNRACTADANARAYLVAVATPSLPELPFTVSLAPGCTPCGARNVTDLEGSPAPALDLSALDRSQILAAASLARVSDFSGNVEVVEVVGRATPEGFVQFDGGSPLTELERGAITQALDAATVRFVPVPVFEELTYSPDYLLLSVAEPAVMQSHLTITTGTWCGNVCGDSGANVVERGDDGTWHAGEPIGPQWMA